MNITPGMKMVLGFMIATIFLTLGLNLMRSPFIGIVTQDASQVTSVTSDAGGLGSMTLATRHFFSDTENLTATGATDGDVTATTTVGADRTTLSFTGLTASTAQNITIGYLEDDGGQINALWKALPFLVLAGVVVTLIGGGFAAGQQIRGSGMSVKILGIVLILVVGALLVGVMDNFTEAAAEAYENTPEFVGVTLGLPLIELGYVMIIIGVVFGALGGGSILGKVSSKVKGSAMPAGF